MINISPDAEQRQAGNADNLNPTNFTYKIYIRPERFLININGSIQSTSSGMTVQADIKTDRRRVIQFFLAPVLKYIDVGMAAPRVAHRKRNSRFRCIIMGAPVEFSASVAFCSEHRWHGYHE